VVTDWAFPYQIAFTEPAGEPLSTLGRTCPGVGTPVRQRPMAYCTGTWRGTGHRFLVHEASSRCLCYLGEDLSRLSASLLLALR